MFSGIVPVLKAYIVDTYSAEEVPKVLAYRSSARAAAAAWRRPRAKNKSGAPPPVL